MKGAGVAGSAGAAEKPAKGSEAGADSRFGSSALAGAKAVKPAAKAPFETGADGSGWGFDGVTAGPNPLKAFGTGGGVDSWTGAAGVMACLRRFPILSKGAVPEAASVSSTSSSKAAPLNIAPQTPSGSGFFAAGELLEKAGLSGYGMAASASACFEKSVENPSLPSKGFLRERPSPSPPSSFTGAASEKPKIPAGEAGSETGGAELKGLSVFATNGASNPPANFGGSGTGVGSGAEKALAGEGSAEKGFSFAAEVWGQALAGSEAASLPTAGAVKGDAADEEALAVTGDQKGFEAGSAEDAAVREGLEKMGVPPAAAGFSGVAPSLGGRVTTESFNGVISVAKSSGQIW